MMRFTLSFIFAAMLSAGPGAVSAEDLKVDLHGVGFTQFGRVGNSTDTISSGAENNFNGNWNQATGGLLTATTVIDENWQGSMGVGILQTHLSRGARDLANTWYPFWVTFVTEANITYTLPFAGEGDKLQVTVGSLPYNYNPDVKNLGLYLLRGYVYPGTLVSGFETKHVIPAASVFGGMVRTQWGGFRNDLILNSETDEKPMYDYSLADVVNYRITDGFEIGAGVNFYRVIPQNSKVTSPGSDCKPSDLGPYVQSTPECYIIERDSAGVATDTITGSLAGTKLMARFRMDPKSLFGLSGPLGKEDLVLYAEAAVLGTKDYPVHYEDIKRRIPVMVGLNLPAFGLLDNLALEVEYYASKNYQDNGAAQAGSWVPRVNTTVDNARDDWKWSLYASRVIFGHVKFSGQLANDHTRPGGFHDKSTGAEAFTTPKDWYWMGKLAYFF